MDKLFIEGRRNSYEPDNKTMTVGELIDALNNLVRWGDISKDAPVYLCNDNGYTYGNIEEDGLYYGRNFNDSTRMYLD